MAENKNEQEKQIDEKLQRKYKILCEQVSQAPNSPHLLIRLGDICLEIGFRQEALLRYKRALELDPNREDIIQKMKDSFRPDELKDVIFPVKALPFWKNLSQVAKYPLTRQGLMIILAGAILFAILDVLSAIPILGFVSIVIQFFFVLPYLLAYMLKILGSSASGFSELPDWPGIADFWDSIYRPCFQIVVAIAVSFCPVILVIILSLFGSPALLVLLPLFIILGIFYYPMALIALALYENTWIPFNVTLIIGSIWKIKLAYFLSLAAIVILIIIEYVVRLLFLRIPFVGPFINWFVTIYFVAVQMHILGNVYYTNKHILRWSK
jgi:tetratricopeptide (TPR) repeat protein